jgi:hypothetical protein
MRGMYATAGDMSSFTGTLLRRQYKPGQKYIQLLFKTPQGVKLALTRDPKMVETLSEGKIYKVEGQDFIIGDKKAVQDPVVAPIQPGIFSKKRAIVLSVAMFLILGVSAYAFFPAKHGEASNNTGTKSTKTQIKTKQTNSFSNTNEPIPVSTGEEPGPEAANQPAASPSSTSQTQVKKQTPIVAIPTPAPAPPSAQPQSNPADNTPTDNTPPATTTDNSGTDTTPPQGTTPEPGSTDPGTTPPS